MPRASTRSTALEWTFTAAGLFLVWRYWFFYDDSFVYFRYVDNLLFQGLGLVYNAGEYVEGFSSPTWTLLLIPLRATGLPWDVLVVGAGLVGFVLFARMLMAVNRGLAPAGYTTNLPLAYLGCTYGVLCYFTSGMETMLVQLMAVGFALFVLRPSSRALQVLMAFLPLVRHELALALLLAMGWSWVARKRPPILLFLLSATLGGAWLAFRIFYYADIFPSTFYLKNGVDPAQGLRYLHDVLFVYHTYELLGAGALIVLLLRLRAVELELARRLVMLGAAASVALYFVKIGGAPIHYRYLAFPFVLAICALAGLPEQALRTFAPRLGRRLAPALGIGIALSTVAFYPRQLDRHPLRAEVGFDYVDRIADAECHRHWIPAEGPWRQVTPAVQRAYRREHPDLSYQGTLAEGLCEVAYRAFDQRVVNSWGLTSQVLARVEAPAARPGHKPRLGPMAEQLAELYESAESVGPGMYGRAIEAGQAPLWVRKNIETIATLERKVYNDHEWIENLRLATTFPAAIHVKPLGSAARAERDG